MSTSDPTVEPDEQPNTPIPVEPEPDPDAPEHERIHRPDAPGREQDADDKG